MIDESRTFAQVLGANVNALRAERGMTHRQLAEAAGIGTTTLNNCINAHHIVSAWAVYRLARALDADIGELMSSGMIED